MYILRIFYIFIIPLFALQTQKSANNQVFLAKVIFILFVRAVKKAVYRMCMNC